MMTCAVATTTPVANLADVADQLIKDRISGMPVVGKDGNVTGSKNIDDSFYRYRHRSHKLSN